MRKIIVVTLLVITLTCSAYAGEMTNDIVSGKPSGAPAGTSNVTTGEMQNGVNDMSSSQSVATSAIQEAEVTLGVIQSVLALV